LHLLPLGAALDRNTNRYAAEDYKLAFAPNLAALQVTLEQVRRRASSAHGQEEDQLLSVAYPGSPESRHYLPYVLPEAEAVARHFDRVTQLYLEAATPEAVLSHAHGQEVIHLGCHGWFDPEAPEQSELMLNGGWLTVQRVITELRLEQTKLATIAACLSGRVQVRRGEEHVGLLQAMMSAGAQSVAASLWPVNDAATKALFEAFYSEISVGQPPAEALAVAARLVRERSGWEHPYYWAAFQVSGLAHSSGGSGSAHHALEDMVTRIDGAHNESMENTRGGSAMSAAKEVQDSLVLLQQLTRYSKRVLSKLDQAERDKVREELRALDDQTAGVSSEAELLDVADAVHRLVEETPALKTLLLPEEMDVEAAQEERRITLEDYGANPPESRYVQEYAPQIRNHIVECRQELERQLQELFSADQERQ
jgi:hypothetical protein